MATLFFSVGSASIAESFEVNLRDCGNTLLSGTRELDGMYISKSLSMPEREHMLEQ